MERLKNKTRKSPGFISPFLQCCQLLVGGEGRLRNILQLVAWEVSARKLSSQNMEFKGETYIRFNFDAVWKALAPIWVILLFSSLLVKEMSSEIMYINSVLTFQQCQSECLLVLQLIPDLCSQQLLQYFSMNFLFSSKIFLIYWPCEHLQSSGHLVPVLQEELSEK